MRHHRVAPQLAGHDISDLVRLGLAHVRDGTIVPALAGGDHDPEDETENEDPPTPEVKLTPEVKGILDKLKSDWETEFKTANELMQAEIAKHGEATPETKQLFDKVSDRLDQLESRFEKAKLDQRAESAEEENHERKAYGEWLRKGKLGEEEFAHVKHLHVTWDEEPRAIERKTMIVSDDTTGGFLAPDDVVNEIIKGVVEFSPMRELCRVRSTSNRTVRWPKRTQLAAAVWVGEQETRAETQNPNVGQEEISTGELHAEARVSFQDLEDAAVDLEAFVNEEFSEQFGVTEATAFVNGDGLKGKPEGFLQFTDVEDATNGIETVDTATNDVLAADDLITVFYLLKDAYARNATWVMKRSTIRDIRKMVDDNSQYLWMPGLAGNVPATILDRPYVEATDMPAVADGAKVIAVGDWRRGYLIVDRVQINTQRDPYSDYANGNIALRARKRVGGQTILSEALKVLTIQ